MTSTPSNTQPTTAATPSAPAASTTAAPCGVAGGALTVTAFDLDRTLIYSTASAGDPATLPPLRTVEHLDGEPLSKMTKTAWRLLGDLMAQAEVVPVTTRTQDQYQRVRFPATPRYAICANGGVLLVNGRRDHTWDAWASQVTTLAAPLHTVWLLMQQVAHKKWVKKTRTAEDLFCYLVATSRKDIPGTWLADFTAQVTHLGWTVSVQGRKVYAVPAGLSKATGLLRLRDLIADQHDQQVRVFSTGDSLLDAPMLTAADAAIRPAHGELHDQDWHADGVAVTRETGALAGEEILGWMLDQATGR